MAEGYWELFRQTGLPLAWLLSRLEEQKQDAAAAFAEENEEKTQLT